MRGMLEFDISDDTSMLIIAEKYDAEDDCCTDHRDPFPAS
jgi:hypothetical protein